MRKDNSKHPISKHMNIAELRAEFADSHHLISTSDGQTIFLREWPTDTKSDIGVLILHGITAYSGPYVMLGEPISKAGYACYGLDLRGHGLSDGIRGDYPSKEMLIEDLRAILRFLKTKHERITILGHSLGVVVGAVMLMHMLEEIDGIIFLSAARIMKEGVLKKRSIPTTLKILFSAIFKPSTPTIHYYRDGMLGLDDPLFNFYYTFRFLKMLNPKKVSLPEKIEVPVYVGIGEEDELFAVSSAESFSDEINASNKEFFVIPNGKHAEFPEGSWDHLIEWLRKNF